MTDRPPCAFLDDAVLHAAGLLESDALAAFATHLHSGCAECAAEVESGAAAFGAVGRAAPPVEPPAGAFDRLLQRARAERPSDEPGVHVVKSADDWMPIPAPGITIRVLSGDVASGTATVLVRFAPGAMYPRHRHGGVEECIVLEGDLVVGDLVLGPGDFQRSDEGSLHAVQTSRGGCLILISAIGGHTFE